MPIRNGFNERYFGRESSPDNKQDALREPFRDICPKCGAVRIDAQIGLEQSPEDYVAALVQVFREVKRVLRDDGVLWLNLGDSYATQGGPNTSHKNTGQQSVLEGGAYALQSTRAPTGLKPKDLIGIPWRLAFALQADGWWLRSDIIWHKPNPMPESVTDRPTKSHEYVFLLTKSARYYWDAEAVKEPMSDASAARYEYGFGGAKNEQLKRTDKPTAIVGNRDVTSGRNIRDVWTIPTKPYKGAHFATYPPALVEPCIKAGTSERGACPTCGTAWERVVERAVVGYSPSPRSNGNKDRNDAQDGRTERQSTTIGWRPACDCYGTAPWPSIPRKGRDEADDAYEQRVAPIRERRAELLAFYDTLPTVPCVVLDPFAGSGTTLLVARDLGRDAVGLDLSYAYLHDQARVRLGLDALDAWQSEAAIDGDCEPLDALPLFAAQEAR